MRTRRTGLGLPYGMEYLLDSGLLSRVWPLLDDDGLPLMQEAVAS